MSALRESAQAEAARLSAAVAGKLAPDPEIGLSAAEGEAGGALSHLVVGRLLPKPLKISSEWLRKLRAMHVGRGGAGEAEAEGRFRVDLARLLLRYKAIGGSGFQAALGGGAFAVLRSAFGTNMETFASPLNARTSPFCSAFADTDRAFGSVGSFLELRPESGSFEASR